MVLQGAFCGQDHRDTIQYRIKKHSPALKIKSLTILITFPVKNKKVQCCVCWIIDIWYRSSFKEVLEDRLEKPQGETPLPLLQASIWPKPSGVTWYMMALTWVLMRWWWAWLLLRYLASITRSPDLQAAVLPIRNNVWALSALCIEERFISNWERNKENNNYKIHKTKINSDGTKRSKFSLIKSLSSPNTCYISFFERS